MISLGAPELARSARISVLEMTSRAKAAHVASSLSCIDILAVLYADVAKVDPDQPQLAGRDIVLLSKGHAAAGLYAVLAHAGFFDTALLDEYCLDGGAMGGHVTKGQAPGVEFSTGSLGHALPYGVGCALAARWSDSRRRVFVVLSDGECDEGSNWEAALVAAHHRLDNLVVVIDRNGLQSLTTTEETVQLEPLAAKWRAFGWHAVTVDGHDHVALSDALCHSAAGPLCIIAKTIKGRGVSFMENQVRWHYRPPSEDDAGRGITEVRGREL